MNCRSAAQGLPGPPRTDEEAAGSAEVALAHQARVFAHGSPRFAPAVSQLHLQPSAVRGQGLLGRCSYSPLDALCVAKAKVFGRRGPRWSAEGCAPVHVARQRTKRLEDSLALGASLRPGRHGARGDQHPEHLQRAAEFPRLRIVRLLYQGLIIMSITPPFYELRGAPPHTHCGASSDESGVIAASIILLLHVEL